MKRTLILLSLVWIAVALNVTANAAPLDMNVLSADANWVVHADYDMFSQSVIGKSVRKELIAQGIEEKLQNFATVFSLGMASGYIIYKTKSIWGAVIFHIGYDLFYALAFGFASVE